VLISDSHRFLFVHVQKTGGSTIDNGLSAALGDIRRIPAANRHAPLDRLLQLEPGLADYWTAGFVRNPWARMLSWWRMMERFRDGAAEGIERYLILRAPDEYPRLRKPQVAFLNNDQKRADFTGRQESLEDDLHRIYDHLGLEWIPLKSVNIDPGRPDYRDVYGATTRQRVAELFEADLREYDYEF
jgi:hypothetical protein